MLSRSAGFSLVPLSLFVGLAVSPVIALAQGVPLDALDVAPIEQEWGKPGAGKSVEGNPLKIGGKEFAHGVGTHANSYWTILLRGGATRFTAQVGVDDEKSKSGSVTFEIWADGAKVAESPILRGGDAPYSLSADVSGAQTLLLVVTDGGDGIDSDHADWADATLTLKEGAEFRPVSDAYTEETTIEDAPPKRGAGGDAPETQIHGPRVTGATPGRPFLFRIPATGTPPLQYAAKNLPAGLTLNSKTGIITGSLKSAGTTLTEITVSGPNGRARRKLAIVGGVGKIALTPPLGWNSWNVWGTAVDDAKVRAAADAFERSGLAAHGFSYINIDDGWQGGRAPDGTILPNTKFPDMTALADYIHAKGLKFGVYSSPGPTTCAGYTGSWLHEKRDAKTYAEWGVDYLKYDWCSYGELTIASSVRLMQLPYKVMGNALANVPRDIHYSLCQYGMGEVWKWGADVGGNSWRTTGDITDSWSSMTGIGFTQGNLAPYAGPGRWNDPDMLVVGYVGWGPNLRPTGLHHNEQMTHLTLWSLLASPLLLGCDLTRMDDFTRSLLTNDDVLDVNQDPLGKPAKRVSRAGLIEIWSRPLFDGTIAVGLFNRGPVKSPVTVRWSDLSLKGVQLVRNLWRREEVGSFPDAFAAQVPAHGAILLKIGKPQRTEYFPPDTKAP